MSEQKQRVGIFTIVLSYLTSNYGSFFQHWALRRLLTEMGYIPFRITMRGVEFSLLQFLKNRVYLLIAIPWHVWRWKWPLREEIRQWLYGCFHTLRFQRDYKKLISPIATEQQMPMDILVGGGDQMWNVSFFERIDCPTITYAASADWLKVSQDQEILHLMNVKAPYVKAISVRENTGVEWLKNLNYNGGNAFHAIDPVFHWTAEDYLALTSKRKILKRPTLLCYFVNIRSKDEFSLEYWEEVARKLGVDLKIIGIQGLQKYVPFSTLIVPSPRDFLRYYRDAKYIVTNSFHGTVFALTMSKPFVCLNQRELPGASQNVRCNELLDWLSLKSHYLPYDASEAEVVSTLNEPIDYTTVHQEIARRRAESKAWLEQALRTCATGDC